MNFNPLLNPIVRAYETASPATELVLPVAADPLDPEWDLWESFTVGALVESPAGSVYRVQGFTVDNLIIATEHGLARTPGVVSYALNAWGLKVVRDDVTVVRHTAGLVEFGG